MQMMMAKSTIDMKYKPFEGHERLYSEWRGATVLFISIFLVFYLALSLGISYIVLRWLLPKKWRGPDFKVKRTMLNNVVGIALFAIIVMLVRAFAQRNFIQMGTGLIINIAWLLEAIFLSLYVRLKGEQMRHAAVIYTPLMVLAFIVILFRIVLIPNTLVSLIFPPILLAFNIWQYVVAKRHRQYLPMLDKVYTHITDIALIFSCIAAWIGYTLLAVQVMIWWTFQLAAIMTITFIYDLTKKYEARYLLRRIGTGTTDMSRHELLRRMKKGEYIDQTWFYDLFCRTIVPILAVLSVLVSIYWAAQVFEMTSLCKKIFMRDIVNQTNIIRISLFWVCMAATRLMPRLCWRTSRLLLPLLREMSVWRLRSSTTSSLLTTTQPSTRRWHATSSASSAGDSTSSWCSSSSKCQGTASASSAQAWPQVSALPCRAYWRTSSTASAS